jgi:spore coat protein U-like protein
MKQRFVLMALLLVACGVQQAVGQVQTCTLTVSALNFATYTSTLLNGSATGKVSCRGNDGWTIPLGPGTGLGATETIRKMSLNGGTLNYQLFTDSARTSNWGNTTGTDLAGNGSLNITVYGQIPAGQYATPGTYTDTVSSDTTSFAVTAVVQAYCTVSATSLTFGTYAGALLSASSTISATCTNSTPYNIGLNAGTATGATVTKRSMIGPSASLLNYKLFSDSGHTTNWGNTVGTDTVSKTGSGAAQSLTVYGQVPAAQYVTPGSYADTIIVTLTY